MTKTDDRCHWRGDLGYRATARHLRGCELAGCDGCEPCSKTHCAMPRCSNHLREHEENICDRCVGRVRDSLERIVQLCGFAPAVAVTSGIHSAVAALVGPVAELSTYRARHDWAVYSRGFCRCASCPDLEPEPEGPECVDWETCEHYVCRRRNGRPTCPDLVDWLEAPDDERHPGWVLESWDRLVAEHLGHRRTLRVTVQTAAAYIEANLTELARMPDFAFDELAREVAECVTHVEQVLLLATRQETGAPCPVCHAQGRKARPLVREFDRDAGVTEEGLPDVSGDYWVCPTAACGQVWTMDEYDRYVERESALHADRLTASQIALTYRVPEATVRKWAERGRVRRRGYDGQRRQLYDVGDVKTCRDGVERMNA